MESLTMQDIEVLECLLETDIQGWLKIKTDSSVDTYDTVDKCIEEDRRIFLKLQEILMNR